MSDHQMGWPMEGKEIKMDFSYQMTDTSEGSPYKKGYAAQKLGGGLANGKRVYPNEPDKARAWTMGWGAAYADNGASPYLAGPARFASGGIVERVNSGLYGERGDGHSGLPGERGFGLLGRPAEAIMPLRRLSEDEGQFCAIAPYPGRNWFDNIEGAVKHVEKLMGRNNDKTLIIAKAARVVSREPQPKPPLRVRHPRPHEFA